MKPQDIQQIGTELALRWDDGAEHFIPLDILRRACPCAGCKGEQDIFGNLYKNPEQPLTSESVRLVRLNYVGGYALQPVWGDNHSTGLFSYDYLRKLGDALAHGTDAGRGESSS